MGLLVASPQQLCQEEAHTSFLDTCCEKLVEAVEAVEAHGHSRSC